MSEAHETDILKSSEKLSELDTPLVVLVQEPNPRLFKTDTTQPFRLDYGEEMVLEGAVPPEKIKELGKVVYEPCFVSNVPLDTEEISSKMPSGYELQMRRMLGPYRVYGIERDLENVDRYFVFGNKKDALRGVAQVMEGANLHYLTAEMDKEPKAFEEIDTKRLRGLTKDEKNELRGFYKNALENNFLARLKQIEKVEDYPKTMLAGLNEIRDLSYPPTMEHPMNDPKWLFFQTYINPLVQYLDYRLKTSTSADHPETLIEAATDYDFVLNLMKFQSSLLIGEQGEPNHRGVLIPMSQIEGSANYTGTSVWLTDKKLVIYDNHQGLFKFPLPEKTEEGEVAIKGGVARLIAKIVLEHPATGELPPSDLDLAAFGELKEDLSLKALKEKYGVEAKDLERITKTGTDGYAYYLGNRDQGLNEVLLTSDGLVLSLNAISIYLQGSTEATAEPYKDIYGRHVMNLERNYTLESLGEQDIFYVKGARFPTPRALSRMYKNVIEGKADSLTIPKGAMKLDIGIHWLVMARKFLSVEDIGRRNELLNKMVLMAYLTHSPYVSSMKNKDDPYEFIEKVKEMAPGGKDFKMEGGELSEKETLDWVATRLVRQITDRLNRYIGMDSVAAFERKLAKDDMLPIQITLPRPERENPNQETFDYEKAILGQRIAFFESFSTVDPEIEESTNYIQEWLENWLPTSPDYRRCPVFTIRHSAKERFYQAARRLAIISRSTDVFESQLPHGSYEPEYNLAWGIQRTESESLFNAVFEEVFHSTGRHFVKTEEAEGHLSGFEDDIKEFRRGGFFEEGLASMALKTFIDEHNLQDKEFIDSDVVSTWAGVALTKVLDLTYGKKEGVITLLFNARLGDKEAELEAAEIIDSRLGQGFFDYLMNLKVDSPEQMISLYERLGIRPQ